MRWRNTRILNADPLKTNFFELANFKHRNLTFP